MKLGIAVSLFNRNAPNLLFKFQSIKYLPNRIAIIWSFVKTAHTIQIIWYIWFSYFFSRSLICGISLTLDARDTILFGLIRQLLIKDMAILRKYLQNQSILQNVYMELPQDEIISDEVISKSQY